jgi:acetyltransferase-like isoleucine patch superfamily enzyme
MEIISKLKQNKKIKNIMLWLLHPPYLHRPRLWVELFWNPFVHIKARHSVISRHTRMDVFPYNKFEIGKFSVVEDFACISNGVGDVIIGERSRIGIGNTVIGPIKIGNNVSIAQNVVFSGLNHAYEDINLAPMDQACPTDEIIIEDDCWIGSNSVITAGVKIGKHVIIAAGSIVTKDVPSFSVVAGSPAKILKRYDSETEKWERV